MTRTLRRLAVPAAALLLTAVGCASTASTSSPPPTTPPSSPSAPAAPTMPTMPSTTAPSSPTAPTTAAAAQIVIDNFMFSPANLTVHPGQSITVVNHDSVTHTLTAGSGGTFDTGPINPGKSATITAPATAGTYPYVCSIHAEMHGTLTVG